LHVEDRVKIVSVLAIVFEVFDRDEVVFVNDRISQLLGVQPVSRGEGVSYWTGCVNYYEWLIHDVDKFFDVLQGVMLNVWRSEEKENIMVAKKLFKKIKILGYALERPPIYGVSVIAIVDEEKLGSGSDIVNAARVLSPFLEMLNGYSKYVNPFVRPRTSLIVYIGVKSSKNLIEQHLDFANKLLKLLEKLKEAELRSEGIVDRLRSSHFFRLGCFPDFGFLSIFPRASNFVVIAGQARRLDFAGWYTACVVAASTNEDLVKPHMLEELLLFPSGPPRKGLLGMYVALNELVYSIALLLWIDRLGTEVSRIDVEFNKLSEKLKDAILRKSPKTAYDTTIRILEFATKISSKLRELQFMKRILESVFKEEMRVPLISYEVEVPIPPLVREQFIFLPSYYRSAMELGYTRPLGFLESHYARLNRSLNEVITKLKQILSEVVMFSEYTNTVASLSLAREVSILTRFLLYLTLVLVVLTAILAGLAMI